MRVVVDLQGAQGPSSIRGVGRYSRELALAMASDYRNHEVIIALNGVYIDTAEELIDRFASVLPRANMKLWYPPRGAAAIHSTPLRGFSEALRAQFLGSLKPDLVLIDNIYEGLGSDIVTTQSRRLEQLPSVAICYDLIPLIRHKEYFGAGVSDSVEARWYYRGVQEMFLCEGLLAISESSRREAIRHLRFPQDRAFNVSAGISPEFRPVKLCAEERAALLQRYGIRRPFILFLGAGDPIRKNEIGLIVAYARLPAALRSAYQLVIVSIVDQSRMRATAAELNIPPEDFVIIPFVHESDLNAFYSSCALFVFPSLHEGFGLPLGEAMACGAPAIGSNTTSIPEVIGRDDATFDPADPDDIAACMRRVLENEAIRNELAAYGPVRAGRFTWQSSAARAWDALEKIHAQLVHRDQPRVGSILKQRPRLAFVSPLPPQTSAIANYSADLLPSLARHYDITLVSENEISDPWLAGAFPRSEPSEFLERAGEFERVLYQIGNSEHHGFQIETLLPRCPGVVVIHDAILPLHLNWSAREHEKTDEFRAMLLRVHGYPALRFDAQNGRDATLQTYSCSQPVLANSIGVIQHSGHEVSMLERHLGVEVGADIVVIPRLRRELELPRREEARTALQLPDNSFIVCASIRSGSEAQRRLVSKAWRQAALSGRLVFIGEAFEHLEGEIVDDEASIVFVGEHTKNRNYLWLAAADAALQLCEASHDNADFIADVLMAGLPLVTNCDRSISELPSGAIFSLPADTDATGIAKALVALCTDAAKRASLAAAGLAYARDEYSPRTIAQRYFNVIERAYRTPGSSIIARSIKNEVKALDAGFDGVSVASHCVARSFPSVWRSDKRPRLLIDMSELARRDAGSGIQRVVREIARRALETPPPGWRGEAVRIRDGRLRYTYERPLAILGHAPLDLREVPLDIRPGDILFCADLNPELSEAEFEELRRLRLEGLRIVPFAHDLLTLRHPELFPAPMPGMIVGWYRRMLRVADMVLCNSRVVADDVIHERVVEQPEVLQRTDHAPGVVVGEFEVCRVDLHLPREGRAQALLDRVPCRDVLGAIRELGVGRNDAELLLARERLLAQPIPALSVRALVLGDPRLRHVMRCVRRARRVGHEEWAVRRHRLPLADGADGAIGERLVERVVGLASGRDLHLHGAGVLVQRGLPLVRLAADEPEEVVEPLHRRPAVEGARDAGLPVGDVVVLAEERGAVAVLAQRLRHHGAALGDLAGVAGEAVAELGDVAGGGAVVVAPSQEGGARRRAERGGVEARVTQAPLGQAVEVGRRDLAAEGPPLAEAAVVDDDQQDVGRAGGGGDDREGPHRRLLVGGADRAVELGIGRGQHHVAARRLDRGDRPARLAPRAVPSAGLRAAAVPVALAHVPSDGLGKVRRPGTNAMRRRRKRRRGRRSERGVEHHVTGHADLVGGDAALEEVGDLLHVLQVHEGERVAPAVQLRQAERRQPLIGAVLEVAPHLGDGEAGHAPAQEILGEPGLAGDRLLEHLRDGARQLGVEQLRLLATDGAHGLEREGHVRALVAAARPCRRPRERRK